MYEISYICIYSYSLIVCLYKQSYLCIISVLMCASIPVLYVYLIMVSRVVENVVSSAWIMTWISLLTTKYTPECQTSWWGQKLYNAVFLDKYPTKLNV